MSKTYGNSCPCIFVHIGTCFCGRILRTGLVDSQDIFSFSRYWQVIFYQLILYNVKETKPLWMIQSKKFIIVVKLYSLVEAEEEVHWRYCHYVYRWVPNHSKSGIAAAGKKSWNQKRTITNWHLQGKLELPRKGWNTWEDLSRVRKKQNLLFSLDGSIKLKVKLIDGHFNLQPWGCGSSDGSDGCRAAHIFGPDFGEAEGGDHPELTSCERTGDQGPHVITDFLQWPSAQKKHGSWFTPASCISLITSFLANINKESYEEITSVKYSFSLVE